MHSEGANEELRKVASARACALPSRTPPRVLCYQPEIPEADTDSAQTPVWGREQRTGLRCCCSLSTPGRSIGASGRFSDL
ncbi:hypothetical protein KL906_005017 [Ogataea polymorpha]|nr:hypothetical protein KL908_004778 [Ogataea polymorpha]KAG7895586.1 hypothetical protein KL936_000294 [Ogataea polymorpha]KAG7905947.1 hypothetical protein KL906_005017 [Ogataea polymorpha]KAG7940613.1 hypothetical protein KL904_000476 [Ogataea polymorpha]